MVDLAPALAVSAALILLNGLFVAAEFAIVGAPRVRMVQRAEAGDKLARRVLAILEDPRLQDRFVATAQIGITLASLGLGMYGEHALATWLAPRFDALGPLRWVGAHGLATLVAIVVLTYFHVVVGEMVPKSLALQYAERTSMRIVRPMLVVQAVFYPLVIALNAIGNGLLALFGVHRAAASHVGHTPSEIRVLVEESRAGGALPQVSGDVLRELFDFGELTAGNVMVPRVRVRGVPVTASVDELRRVVREAPHVRYPVFEGGPDRVVGVVHMRDVLRLLLENRGLVRADVRDVPRVPEAARLDAVIAAMRFAGTELAVVLDEHGGTAGIVTTEDLFEEVVGEIEEGEHLRPEAFEDEDGVLHVVGTMRLGDVGDRLDARLDHPEVTTVSGLVLTLLGRPAVVGDEVEHAGFRFTVTAVTGHGVQEARVQRGGA